MPNLAWNGYQNGQIPTSAMRLVRDEWFEPEAARHLEQLETAFGGVWGYPAIILEGYRSLATQQALYQHWIDRDPGYNLAAYPGTSNHGYGRAADFASHIDVYGSPQKKWMDANAPTYGWHPTGNKFKPREAWHFDYWPGTALAGGDSTPITDEEISKMATGQLFKSKSKATVWWQEKPNTPFLGLDSTTYKSLLALGMKRGADIPDRDMNALLKKWGTITRPRGSSARGVAYRCTDDGKVYWQEKPGMPLYWLNQVEWATYEQNGLLFVDYSAAQLAPLLEIK